MAALDELVPLYAVYPLLFAAHGLSVGQISGLYLLWSLTGFVLEVPSGALADRVSRRRLLAVAGLLEAVGYALWVFTPSFPAFAAGFVLWGVGGAFTSGTREALIYDELAAAGAADRYPAVIGRTEVLGTLGVVASTVLALPAMALGGYRLTGILSVATCLGTGLLALGLPERPRVEAADEAGGVAGYLHTLRTGVTEARSDRRLRRLVLIAAMIPGLTALDEYMSLLAGDTGVRPGLVPVLMLASYAGLVVGAEWAGRRPGISPRRLAALTTAGAVLLAGGSLSGHPLGFLGIGGWYLATWYGSVVSGARLQAEMTGAARATVTSVSALLEETFALLTFAAFGLAGGHANLSILIAAGAVPTVLIAALLPRWLPPARPPPPG
ncbi:MAG TPA: MFS transporter [Mycobacteriales bacterium]|nr:MFS transporter [Mycobacteriales bacterium]